MNSLVKLYNEININDTAFVGGKNASLGEMFNKLSSKGVLSPDGFATTSFAFKSFLKENQLSKP